MSTQKSRAFPQYSVRLLLLMVTVVAMYLAYRQTNLHRGELVRNAREVVGEELVRIHAASLMPDKTAARFFTDKLSRDLSRRRRKWSFETLAAPGDGLGNVAAKQDDFAREALRQIEGGAKEFAVVGWNGEVRYATGMDTQVSACSDCHFGGRVIIVSVRRSPQ